MYNKHQITWNLLSKRLNDYASVDHHYNMRVNILNALASTQRFAKLIVIAVALTN